MIDERTEILINRSLDGELTEDEKLELNKLLIRSPEARALLQEFTKLDECAGDALSRALGNRSTRSAPVPTPAEVVHNVTVSTRKPLLASGFAAALGTLGIAAALTFMVTSTISKWNGRDMTGTDDGMQNTGTRIVDQFEQSVRAPVIEGPRHERQRIHRDVVGVFDDETQSLYLLERDREQTTIVPVVANY